ncbi:MAG: hypothetical protein IAF38_05150 [Bacteroidia bacterium]|nr:hypothetical protein [Bacteroidia bacterium]
MKKIILCSIIAIALLTSCEKNDDQPLSAPSSATTTVESINVEYKVHANSGSFSFEYIAPDAAGKPVTLTGTSNKMDQSFSFNYEKYKTLKIKAKNISSSSDEVTVEIYVNGSIIVSGSANAPGAWASAEGSGK